MKQFLIFLFVLIAQYSYAQAVIKWDATEHNFDKVKQGVPVTHEFKFINTGKEPLIITNVGTSCGCTVPKYSKDPIPPNGDGFIQATFNAANVGSFNKTLTVTANIDGGTAPLIIKGEVVPADQLKQAAPKATEATKKEPTTPKVAPKKKK